MPRHKRDSILILQMKVKREKANEASATRESSLSLLLLLSLLRRAIERETAVNDWVETCFEQLTSLRQ